MLSGVNNEVLAFGGFRLEPAERRLTRDGAVVDVSGRYLDALLLLARQPGELVTKDRFMAEVWRGVPVTDEALTQCIRSLRKALGDRGGQTALHRNGPAARLPLPCRGRAPRVQPPTVQLVPAEVPRAKPIWLPWFDILLLGWRGLAGGAAAGLLGGSATACSPRPSRRPEPALSRSCW